MLGSSIDPYMHLSLACEFHSWHPIDLGAYVESGKSLSSYQAREFPAHDISFQKKHESYKFWFHFSLGAYVDPLGPKASAWILAIAYFFHSLLCGDVIADVPALASGVASLDQAKLDPWLSWFLSSWLSPRRSYERILFPWRCTLCPK